MVMDALMLHFKESRIRPHDDARMCHALDMGKFIMEKYYRLSRTIPIYAAAVLLDPAKREAYARKNWDDDYVQRALEFVGGIYPLHYPKTNLSHSRHRLDYSGWNEMRYMKASLASIAKMILRHAAPRQRGQGNPRRPTALDDMLAKVNVQSGSTDADDLSSFTTANTINLHGQSPIEWWCRKEQRYAYPRLHRMAIDILSIPPMSDEPERVFSGACRTITWDRHNLTSKDVEMIEILAGIKEGIVGRLEVDTSLEELVAGMELRDDDVSELVPVICM